MLLKMKPSFSSQKQGPGSCPSRSVQASRSRLWGDAGSGLRGVGGDAGSGLCGGETLAPACGEWGPAGAGGDAGSGLRRVGACGGRAGLGLRPGGAGGTRAPACGGWGRGLGARLPWASSRPPLSRETLARLSSCRAHGRHPSEHRESRWL